MKIGIRTPSVKKSIIARTTGRINREIKKSINPMYGKKGMGIVNDPKKAIYNKVYNKTTVSAKEVINDKVSFSESLGAIFGLIGNIIMVIVSLAQVLFWGAFILLILYLMFIII